MEFILKLVTWEISLPAWQMFLLAWFFIGLGCLAGMMILSIGLANDPADDDWKPVICALIVMGPFLAVLIPYGIGRYAYEKIKSFRKKTQPLK